MHPAAWSLCDSWASCYILDPLWPAHTSTPTCGNASQSPSPTSETDLSREHSFNHRVWERKGWRVVNNRCETTCTSRRRPLLDNAATRWRWGRGENTASCPADNMQSHRPPSRPTGQVSQRPGHRSRHRTVDREVWTGVRVSSLIISNASNCSSLTAASAHVPISRIHNRDMRMRTRIRFDSRFFDCLHTCVS